MNLKPAAQHCYRDYSQVAIDDPVVALLRHRPVAVSSDDEDDDWNASPEVASFSFPARLHQMLAEHEQSGDTALLEICSYQSHGRCFKVHKPTEFVEMILSRWFRKAKFASFQRHLFMYGFQRVTSGPDKNAYYHELFLRGKPFLAECISIVPQHEHRHATHAPNNVEDAARQQLHAPNFYEMPFMPSL